MEKLRMETRDGVERNVERIGALFPNVITEVKRKGRVERAIDFDALRQELSKEIVEGREERYQFTWPDKKKAVREASRKTRDTLRPCREESVSFDTTENLYIEGDNLRVLKLLQEDYLGKIKMIYIDPPYNTGNDFVYRDDFSMDAQTYKERSGQTGEDGERLEKNPETNGRFHTDWLNMIYPRLKVAKNLLSEDGVIFISIDDNEQENLKKICDEIFGPSCFVSNIIWEKADSPRMDAKEFSSKHDFVLLYKKSPVDNIIIKDRMKEAPEHYDKIADDGRRYYLKPLRYMGNADKREDRPNLYFPIKTPNGDEIFPIRGDGTDGRWRWSKEKVLENFDRLEFVNGRKGVTVYTRIYADSEAEIPIETIWYNSSVGSNRTAMSSIKKVFEGKKFFDTPKPIELIKRMLEIIYSKNSIILDFFSGSATTAHAVMSLNAEDGGKRKFIMVQLPELTDEKGEAFKAGYKNICEIGKERIRRAGKAICPPRGGRRAAGCRHWLPRAEARQLQYARRLLSAGGAKAGGAGPFCG